MAQFKDIIKISATNYDYLVANGSVVINGVTHLYDNRNLYLTDEAINVIVDDTLSATSEHAVQNKIIKRAIDTKVDKVTGSSLVQDTKVASYDSHLTATNPHSITCASIGASATSHNHDSAYSGINHNHDTAYSPILHNHDTAYSSISHNHDTAYSSISHNHDTTYMKIADLPLLTSVSLLDSSAIEFGTNTTALVTLVVNEGVTVKLITMTPSSGLADKLTFNPPSPSLSHSASIECNLTCIDQSSIITESVVFTVTDIFGISKTVTATVHITLSGSEI